MKLPFLYVVINVDGRDDVLEFIGSVFAAGVRLIQLRAKEMQDEKLIELARSVLSLRDETAADAVVLINDRPEVCLACGADGVHVGQDDRSPAEVRELLGENAVIGFSTHTDAQLEAVPQSVLSYAALGPIFLSPTKQGHAEVVGVERLRGWRSRTELPLVAIGGVTAENAEGVYRAGADCIAVISDIERTEDITFRVGEYRAAWEHARA